MVLRETISYSSFEHSVGAGIALVHLLLSLHDKYRDSPCLTAKTGRHSRAKWPRLATHRYYSR